MSVSGKEETLFFSSYAKLPSGTTACEMYKIICIGVELDCCGNILDAECTLATEVGKRFFKKMVVGKNLDRDLAEVILCFEKRYHGSAQKAIITALKIVQERFRVCRDKFKIAEGIIVDPE